MKGKEFIYRGDIMEKPADFTAKITTQFPNAELLKSTEPSPDVINGDGQCMSSLYLIVGW
jgi:hypothetical protein